MTETPNEPTAETQETPPTDDGPPSEAPTGQTTETQSVSAEEYARLQRQHQELQQAVQNYISQQQQQQYQAQQQQAQTQNETSVDVDPDDILTDPQRWQQSFEQRQRTQVEQMLAQAATPVLRSNAEMAKSISRQDPEVKDIWDKWGSEIESIMNSPQVRLEHRANPETWKNAARVVRSNHMDEIVAERAKQMAAELSQSATESTGDPGGYESEAGEKDAWQKLSESEYGKRLLERHGRKGIRENCRAMGVSLDKYAQMCAETNIIVSDPSINEWKNNDLVRNAT